MKITTLKNTTVSVPVSAWACGMCQCVYADKKSADECCKCGSCGKKFKKRSSYDSNCEVCSYGQELRNTRADVRRCQNHLRMARERLERLLKEPPPGRKAPKS
jgi:hypothetical protein